MAVNLRKRAADLAVSAITATRPLFSAKVRMSVPAIAGMILIPLGVSLIYLPAGLIVAGLLCLRIDYRM